MLQLLPDFVKIVDSKGGVINVTELQDHLRLTVNAPTALDTQAHMSEDSLPGHGLLTNLDAELEALNKLAPH